MRRITSEPPPGDSTQAYDQEQFTNLIRQIDGAPQDFAAIQTPYPVSGTSSSGTYREAGAAGPSRPVAGDILPRRDNDTISDGDDVTTAYVRGGDDDSEDVHARATVVGVAMTNPGARESASSEPNNSSAPPLSLTPGHQLGRSSPWRARLIWSGLALSVASLGLYGWTHDRSTARRIHLAASSLRSTLQHGSAWATRALRSAEAADAVDLVRLEITAAPAHARIYMGGREVSNPLKVPYPKSSARQELQFVAEGFETQTQWVSLDRDLSMFIGLAPLPSASPPPDPQTHSTAPAP